MLWIGLTGGIACGKSAVSAILKTNGVAVIDADLLAREVVQPGTEAYCEIIAHFGRDALLVQSGVASLNREKIGEIVFQDPAQLTKLESIIHPRVRALLAIRRAQLAAQGEALGVYDVPLLFEKKMESSFDHVVVVSCRPETQLKRLMARSQLGEAEARRRVLAQLPLLEKVARAHEVIENDGDQEALRRVVEVRVAAWRRRAHQAKT